MSIGSKFQTSNKPLSADNRAVFGCGLWGFPLITPPQFRLGCISLGVIITETYFMIFTILCSPDKVVGLTQERFHLVYKVMLSHYLIKHHTMRAYGECTYIFSH